MRKITAAAASLAVGLALTITGCARLGGTSFQPAENSALILKDGGVQWASIETWEQGDYSEEEMIAFAKEQISEYNRSLGKEGASENEKGGEPLPVAFVSGSLSEGKASLITEYDTPSRLVEFAQEIGDNTVPFTLLETGRAASMGSGIGSLSFTDQKGNSLDGASVLAEGEKAAVRAEGAGLIQTEGEILYVSHGCTFIDKNTVKTSPEGSSYIILK